MLTGTKILVGGMDEEAKTDILQLVRLQKRVVILVNSASP
jgi:hypothetical protein